MPAAGVITCTTSTMALSLKELRAASGLSLRDVQEMTVDRSDPENPRVGVWAAHLSEMERGKRMPSPEQLVTLSGIYGVTTEGWTLMYVHVAGEK